MNKTGYKTYSLGALLAVLMAATRMHHFAFPPDASLAVFLLAGFLVQNRLFFGALLIEAGLLDYFAISHMGVSDYCFTPAYWFLIPTYAVLWYAGRSARAHREKPWLMAVTSLFAVSVAFLISNFSFYLFSGNYGSMSLATYALRIAHYYLPYVSSAAIYLIPAFILQFARGAASTRHA